MATRLSLMRWRDRWQRSLRFRLIALGLMPLVVAFPLVIAVMLVVGGQRADELMLANLRGNLGGAAGYLTQLRTETGVRIDQLAKSERLAQLVVTGEIDKLADLLTTAARGGGLDYLLVADGEGRVLASSTGVADGLRLPDSFVIRQALIGVATTAFEIVGAEDLPAFSPEFRDAALIAPDGRPAETRGLLINAAAHFPLMRRPLDAILVGGILLNRNVSVIEHMREIVYPVGALPGDAEGLTAILLGDTAIAVSRQRQQGPRTLGTRTTADISAGVLGEGQTRFDRVEIGYLSYRIGHAPLADGEGRRIGMVTAGFPDAAYYRAAWILLGMIAALLAATMLAISLLFLGAGREMTRRLAEISQTMERVRGGDRSARAGPPVREDELGQLKRDFDSLLDTIALQDEVRRQDEAKLEEYRRDLEILVERRTHELNDRSEQLNAIFALSPDGFVSFDRARRVQFANQAFLSMTGLARDEVIGHDEAAFSQRLAERCVPTARFVGVAALRQEREQQAEQAESGDSDGPRRHVFELAGPGGRVVDVGTRLSATGSVAQILYFSDVTHETEVDRMKSEFLAAAAHELRTPMASIYGFAELLMAQGDELDAEMRLELVSTIYRQSELMASIINELLDLARIEARRGKDFIIETVELHQLVAEAVASYKPPTGRAAPLLPPPGEPLPLKVDRKKLQQALLNVLSNAYKYSPQGGAVEVAVCHDAGRVGVTVRDHGIGMTPEQLARVFERFYRADDSGAILGTGLGMSIVKEIIELHGGEVELASAPGDGTTVTLWLPAATRSET